MSEPARLVHYSGLLDVLLPDGLGNVADRVIACLARADRQSLGLACKALQDVVAPRWRCLRLDAAAFSSSSARASFSAFTASQLTVLRNQIMVFRRFKKGDWKMEQQDWSSVLPMPLPPLPLEVLRSKLLPKLRGVEELIVKGLDSEGQMQDFYRLLLALRSNGAQIKAISVETVSTDRAGLAGQQPEQPHDWVLTADSLQQLQPVPHLERLCVRLGAEVDAALLQPLLCAPALKTVKLDDLRYVTDRSSLDLSACSQLQELDLCAASNPQLLLLLTACLPGLQPASGLKKLKLVRFVAHSQWLEYISRSLPQLETLHLVGCQLPEPDVDELQQPCFFPSLKELRLNA